MKQPTIKFSHGYTKLLNAFVPHENAKLLEVLTVNLEELSTHFLDYDTDDGTFQLPESGKFLCLLFLKPKTDGSYNVSDYAAANLFTTLRRWTPAKETYYRSLIGENFAIEIPNPQSAICNL
jgi:hypothetical protein